MKNSNCLKNVWAQVQLKINNANKTTIREIKIIYKSKFSCKNCQKDSLAAWKYNLAHKKCYYGRIANKKFIIFLWITFTLVLQ